jgi:hypothetical protein
MLEMKQLETLLTDHNITLEQWSYDLGTKTIDDLYKELTTGESILEIRGNQLVRITRIASIEVKVKLGEKTFTLVEDKQIFLTGSVRKRGLRNISEKITQDETPESAAYRGLKEETGLNTNKPLSFLGERETQNQSSSYPGLYSIYQIFNYQITLDQEDLKSMNFFEYRNNKITFFTLD